MIKKSLFLLALTLVISLGSVSTALATNPLAACSDNDATTPCNVIDPACEGVSNSTLCSEAGKNQSFADNGLFGVNGILNKATNFLLVIIGIAGVIMIMIGGIQYTLSSGDPQRVNRSKDMIIYAIVGLVVAIIAKAIVAFVINRVA